MLELPLEVIEKILEKLLSETSFSKDDMKTVLNVRLVNSIWRDGMENVLEQKCLGSWTQWKIVRNRDMRPLHFNWLHMQGSKNVQIVQSMETLTVGNPVISRSLYTTDIFDIEKKGWKIVSTEKLFSEWDHGQNITSFKTRQLLTPKEMHKVLSLLPNLKAVGAPISIGKDEDSFMKTQPLPPLPNLKFLELRCLKPENKYKNYIRWFLNAYGAQVVYLKLAAENLVALRNKKNSINNGDSELYKNLRMLKVSMPGGTFFKKTDANFPLTHLSIEHYESPVSWKGLTVITIFVDKFAKTLVKLHLDINFGDDEVQTLVGVPSPPSLVTYPRLLDFAYNMPHYNLELEASIIKIWFMQRFPELKQLQLLGHNSSIEKVVRNFVMNPGDFKRELEDYFCYLGFWTTSPKLKKINLRTYEYENGDEEVLEIQKTP